MHNITRMERQLALLDALATAEIQMRADNKLNSVPGPIVDANVGALLIAARIEELIEAFEENIHRAGEGI